ncbi:ribonuclease III [Christensenellaceae bacterium OttesenSCG-928-L17]|nr:ribonuclease III [Christensenellaceae bacterium OttesenSCG-928-L17]
MSAYDNIHHLLGRPKERNAAQMSAVTLAYMGDAVYDLYVRALLVELSDATARGLHMRAAKLVCASAQAAASVAVLPLFNEQESAIFRRGRNAHMGTTAKNASIADYRAATGLEAVIGYLFLSGDDSRLEELMRVILADLLKTEPSPDDAQPTT